MAKNITEKYQKKTDKQHILDNPDTYIGSIELVESNEFIFGDDCIKNKNIEYIPGLYKLFDEGIVNCRDHVVRMDQALKNEEKNCYGVTYIDIGITDDGTITMINDGNGIDIAQHPEYKIWIPEMIFGHLRTSTNYDKTEKKIVGGKNGFGFKLVLIWSTWGRIETVDHTRGLKYVQEFKDNLDIMEKPIITKCKNKPYTKISFKPDYKRLGISGLSADMLALFKRRIYDIAAVTDKTVKVKYNSVAIPIKTFQQYVHYITGKTDKGDTKYEEANSRWEYAVSLSEKDEFYQVSFVNGIYTSKGGKHVEYILNQIVRKLSIYIKTKKKIDVKPSAIKEQLALFIRCDIENPAFDSQTKDYMNTPISKFGSTCVVSDKFIEKIAKMGVMNTACALTEVKENLSQKKTDGTKNKNIRGIPKLIDANFAGTTKSNKCMLILCEGDSAKAGIVSGLSKDDRNFIGVYPMKGKMFNVRGENIVKIGDNKEICEIKQIVGLEHGKVYDSDDVQTKLRYGKIIFMTDQDLDGSHIKGLGINLFEAEWRSLIEIPGFIGYMNTPILKATKGKEIEEFYNEGEFNKWKETDGIDIKKWIIKYYKGLGTSTSKEFKEYFAKKKIVTFESNGESSLNTIDMVFNKKRSDDRKEWLANYNRDLYLDTSKNKISYEEFIHNDLIHFSKYDNDRSIPNLLDGLKISLRKILYSAFKKNLHKEIKVAQFSGYVSEQSCYHHGEASLNGAIVGMAQNFVGSNNINLLEPRGQFGCVDPETQVLMWCGKTELAKNIKVGDKLIGDDGNPRMVNKLVSGMDQMYLIKNSGKYATNYIVNSNHILTLCFPNHRRIFWRENNKSWNVNYYDEKDKTIKIITEKTNKSTKCIHHYSITKDEAIAKIKERIKDIPENNIFDINLQAYLKLPESMKKQLYGIYNCCAFNWDNKELKVDPYLFGKSMVHFVYNNGADEIPNDYIVNAVDKRLQLLAGVMDEYGQVISECEYKLFGVNSENKKHFYKIVEDLKIICISVGLRAIINDLGLSRNLMIYGNNLSKIPVRNSKTIKGNVNHITDNLMDHRLEGLYHKHQDNLTEKHVDINRMIYKIKIETHSLSGSYCGWHIDGNERFLLADGTITHNTRLQGGKDAASERYIFTQLNKLTRLIYPEADDKILTYLNDDGTPVEPIYYVPIIPMVLINGSKGIGTGFSTDIMCYNPLQIINKLIRKLKEKDDQSILIEPYYHGFKGTIRYFNDANRYLIKGVYNVISKDKIQITELPIGTWTEDYKQFLEGLINVDSKKKPNSKQKSYVKDYNDTSTDCSIDFVITFQSGVLKELIKETVDCSNNSIHECNALEKYLKLYTLHSNTNMHLFDDKEKLRKYENVNQIIDQFYVIRLAFYEKRRNYLIENLEKELKFISNKATFIRDNLDGKIDMRRKNNRVIVEMLREKKYDMKDDDNYEYLIGMPMKSVSQENIERLEKEVDKKKYELEQILKTKKEKLWINELETLKEKYVEFIK